MADVQHQFDDPRWTAFVLGELDADEAQQLADCLAADPLLRRRIDELRETAELLRMAFDAESEELPPIPNTDLREATRRAAQQMAVRSASHFTLTSRPTRTRAVPTVVALASLAMVAVTLLVTTVAPNQLVDSTPAVPVAPAAVTWTEHFVWNTYNDANGVERINVAFRVTGDESLGDIQRDFDNGLNYVSLAVDDSVQRMYVVENEFSMPTEFSDGADWESLGVVSLEQLTEESQSVNEVEREAEMLRQITLSESGEATVQLNRQRGVAAGEVDGFGAATADEAREPQPQAGGVAGEPGLISDFQQSGARRYGGGEARFVAPGRPTETLPENAAIVPRPYLSFNANGDTVQDAPAAAGVGGGFGGGGGESSLNRTWSFSLPSDAYGASATWEKFLSPLSSPVSEMPVSNDGLGYQIVAEYLGNGFLPPAESVYVDDFVNHFAFAVPVTNQSRPVAVTIEATACPWQPEHRLARVTVSARPVAPHQRAPVNMVAVVDRSESMYTNGRLKSVETVLASLSDQLTEQDRFALVTNDGFAAEAGDARAAVQNLRERTRAAAVDDISGLRSGFEMARKQYLEAGSNEVLFCTDAAFNNPMTREAMLRLVELQANSNETVTLNGLGIQPHSADRPLLIELVNTGNGLYDEIDVKSPAPAAYLEMVLGGAATVAEDIDIQVSFNPVAVHAYRRIGSKFDASVADTAERGETVSALTAGTSVTSLYEYVPRAKQADDDPNLIGRAVWQRLNQDAPLAANVQVRRMKDRVTIDGIVATEQHKRELERSVAALSPNSELIDNRVQVVASKQPGVAINDAFTVHVKYRQPETGEEVRFDQVFVDDANSAPSPELKWAALVAEFGLMLETPSSLADASLERLLAEVEASDIPDDATRQQLAELVKQSRVMHEATRQSGNGAEPNADAGVSLFSAGGKYVEPFTQITAPQDAAWYGTFYDFGRWDGGSYAGRTDLPPAYWVYVYPNWYIWRETAPLPAGDANE